MRTGVANSRDVVPLLLAARDFGRALAVAFSFSERLFYGLIRR